MATRTERLVLGTRKGVILLEKRPGGWSVFHKAFPGVPVSYAARDPRTGVI